MLYSVVYPYPTMIDAESIKEAIKRYLIINHEMQINQMIITDQRNHINADLKYYRQNNTDKVGMDIYPISPNYVINPGFMGPIPVQSLAPSRLYYAPPVQFVPKMTNILGVPRNM